MKRWIVLLVVAAPAWFSMAAQEPPPQPQPASSAATASPAPVPVTISLGEFAVKVAFHLQLPAPAGGFTPEGAAWALLHKGVRLRPELGSPLVEGDVVEILTGLGFHLRTTTPSRVMTRDRLDAIISVFLAS